MFSAINHSVLYSFVFTSQQVAAKAQRKSPGKNLAIYYPKLECLRWPFHRVQECFGLVVSLLVAFGPTDSSRCALCPQVFSFYPVILSNRISRFSEGSPRHQPFVFVAFTILWCPLNWICLKLSRMARTSSKFVIPCRRGHLGRSSHAWSYHHLNQSLPIDWHRRHDWSCPIMSKSHW